MARRTRPATVRRYREDAGLDRYRNPVPGYVDEAIEVYYIAPATSVEERDGARVAVVTGAELAAPLDTVIGPHDLIVDAGIEYAVDGEVGRWHDNPVGIGITAGGLQVNLTRSTG